jgi:hypothetical protein
MNKSFFSTKPYNIVPVLEYSNADTDKVTAACGAGRPINDNRGKSGVYRWTNKLNRKSYVGSGVDLAKRLRSYYNENDLKKNSRPIQDALLKA